MANSQVIGVVAGVLHDEAKPFEIIDLYESFCQNSVDVYPMEFLDEYFSSEGALFAIERAYFGSDYDGKGPFNPTDDYFTINGYGNLVSMSEGDYADEAYSLIDDELAEAIADCVNEFGVDGCDLPGHIADAIEEQLSYEA